MARKHERKSNGSRIETEMPNTAQLRMEIEHLAYRFYCECGYEHGHDLEHWTEAERQVFERYQGMHKATRP